VTGVLDTKSSNDHQASDTPWDEECVRTGGAAAGGARGARGGAGGRGGRGACPGARRVHVDKTLLFSTARVCPTQPAPQTQAEEANRARDARDSAGLLLRIREALDAHGFESSARVVRKASAPSRARVLWIGRVYMP